MHVEWTGGFGCVLGMHDTIIFNVFTCKENLMPYSLRDCLYGGDIVVLEYQPTPQTRKKAE